MHLIELKHLTPQQIAELFAWAQRLQLSEAGPLLEGKHFALFFPATSVRTRLTFEQGIRSQGGACTLFPPETLDRAEQLQDTVAYLANWADGIVVRHNDFAVMQEMAAHSPVPVINAMSAHNHPCEILADLYAISQLRADYRELTYTFVGPAGNIARSWADIAQVLGLRFNHVCQAGEELAEPSASYTFRTDLDAALAISDIVLTDSLPQSFLTEDYLSRYQITHDRMKLAKPHALLNPCPPFFRGAEVSEDAVASDYFVGYAFKKPLMYVQQAILFYCLSR
ncbi:ornithine carbamoyltransferase [Paenibacillus athensensis]|uniref:Ornithine carbamoyltransferase n=1 Tax=Paenibacillus athensensis TaxID=1967502 RepID=A0A4Y8QAJ1_9BACL|nr:ornithine carbamoyltransferase [Paenibacillus athensensis]MCD1257634.1 ornithine carbamoyltransferase [Paenibacillus athensensis]